MIVKVHRRKECPFAQIERVTLKDKSLSWRARGLLAYFLALPSSTKITICAVIAAGPDGRECVQAGLHELSEHGYADLVIIRDANGRVKGKQWCIYECPKLLTDERESRLSDRRTGKPSVG